MDRVGDIAANIFLVGLIGWMIWAFVPWREIGVF
jgi:hypothetical protein